MKANEAPEKLYIDSREHWMKSWTAFTTKAKGDDIEYTRTDAFIKKAYDWLLFHANSYIQYNEIVCEECLSDDFLKDFKNYMKGE